MQHPKTLEELCIVIILGKAYHLHCASHFTSTQWAPEK